MSDQIQGIFAVHPGPWRHQTTNGVFRNGMAEILVFDANNKKVELFTLMNAAIALSARVATNVAAKAATAPTPT